MWNCFFFKGNEGLRMFRNGLLLHSRHCNNTRIDIFFIIFFLVFFLTFGVKAIKKVFHNSRFGDLFESGDGGDNEDEED